MVDPLVYFIDFFTERFGVEVQRCFVGGKQVIEGGVEDADDFRALIIDNRSCLPIPQDRNGEPWRRNDVTLERVWSNGLMEDVPATEVGICLEVEISNVLRAIQRIVFSPRERVHLFEWPA